MGTVVTDIKLTQRLEEDMHEALKEFETIDNYQEKTVEGEIIRSFKKGAYRKIYMKDCGNTKVTVLSLPRHYFAHLPKYRLILHLSQFKNLHMVWLLLVTLFKEELAKFIFFVAKIVRLDVWWDTDNSYKACLRVFNRKKIGATTEWKASKQNRKGTYFGSMQSLSYYYVYQKKTKYINGVNVTRIEKRYSGAACPISNLSEYHKLSSVGVFDDLDVYIPKIKFQVIYEKEKSKLNPNIVHFLKEYLEDGLQCARKQVSRDKSYKDVWSFFTLNCDLVSLTPSYNKSLKNFTSAKEVIWT